MKGLGRVGKVDKGLEGFERVFPFPLTWAVQGVGAAAFSTERERVGKGWKGLGSVGKGWKVLGRV